MLTADGSVPRPMGPTCIAFTKPVIAAVEGQEPVGLELALACDLPVAAKSAVLGVFCRRWGVPLIDGGTIRVPRIVGMGRALDMILAGRAVAADEAEDKSFKRTFRGAGATIGWPDIGRGSECGLRGRRWPAKRR